MGLPWRLTRRPEQEAPSGDWFAWLILAGRGWGKTRTGAEFIIDRLLEQDQIRAALVGITFDDVRDTMVEGESGLQSILDARKIRHNWNRSLGQLTLRNGSRADTYSSERPRQLRGPQHHVAWGDEPAHWNDADLGDVEDTTWSNLKLGLRLGEDPRVVLTTTPQHVRLLYGLHDQGGLLRDPLVVLTKGSTYDNLDNLSPSFRRTVVEPYEGTRLGRQELHAEDIGDVEGALWTRDLIVYRRPPQEVRKSGLVASAFERVIVGIDPNTTGNGDEAGIIVGGRSRCDLTCKPADDQRLAGIATVTGCGGHGWAIDDRTVAGGPSAWAAAAVRAYRDHQADGIVAESNNGGEMVRITIASVDPTVPVSLVHASRGKWTRAEPVEALYERRRISHVVMLPELESEMTRWVPGSGESPNRLDAHVWAMTALMLAPWQMAGGATAEQSWIA